MEFPLLLSFFVPELSLAFAFFDWTGLPISTSVLFARRLLVSEGRIIPGRRDEIALEVIGEDIVDWLIVVEEDGKGV